jgi:hypothetical protein
MKLQSVTASSWLWSVDLVWKVWTMNLENVKTDDVLDLYVKFIYSEKATQFCEISNQHLTGTT